MEISYKDVERRFIAILNSFNHPHHKYIKNFHSYRFVKKCLTSKSQMIKYYDLKINDVRYIRNSIVGKILMDAGCGAGTFSILLSLLGAKQVYAIDHNADCVKMTKSLVGIANLSNIEAIHSDVGKVRLPKASVDGVFSIEGISHYRDYKAFLKMSTNVLTKGGFLYIRDGNNAMSPFVKKRAPKIWDTFENSPKGTIVFETKTNDICYLDMRKRIIEKNFTTLSHYEIEKFAKWTFAYSKDEIITVVDQFLKDDFSLKSEYAYGKCPLNPETNCYIERLFNPVSLKHELKYHGFRCKIKSRGPSSRRFTILRFPWELCSVITIFLPGGFRLIGRKT